MPLSRQIIIVYHITIDSSTAGEIILVLVSVSRYFSNQNQVKGLPNKYNVPIQCLFPVSPAFHVSFFFADLSYHFLSLPELWSPLEDQCSWASQCLPFAMLVGASLHDLHNVFQWTASLIFCLPEAGLCSALTRSKYASCILLSKKWN